MNTSFSFTYKGRKTARYVFKRMAILLAKGEAWFKVNFTSPKECAMIDAAAAVEELFSSGSGATLLMKVVDGKLQVTTILEL